MFPSRYTIRNICFVTSLVLLVYFIGNILNVIRHENRCLPKQHYIQLKKDLTFELRDLYAEIAQISSNKIPKVLHRFENIFKRLDSDISLYKKHDVQVKDRGAKLDVCPEKFQGTNAGYPYYEKGWNTTKCENVNPLRLVITFLINAVRYSSKDFSRLKYVLNGIKQFYPSVKVFLAIHKKQQLTHDINEYDNLEIVKFDFSASALVGKVWNALVRRVSTPYVLLARDVVHFSWLAQIERQIRIVSELPNVGVAGGAYRNTTGHWQMGCFQTSMKNYVLKYQEGYYHSRNECMLCDYLQGPFVVKTNLVKFDENMNDETSFEDFFLTLVKNKILVMGCPDAMYFTKDKANIDMQESKQNWRSLAKKWVLNRVILPGAITHKFSCSEIGFEYRTKHTRSYLLPVCLQEQYEHALRVLQEFTNTVNISFELDTGSVLGTVKYDGMMPWDMDGDVRVKSTEIHIFDKADTKKYFEKYGLKLTKYEKPTFNKDTYDGYVKLSSPQVYIEVWGRPMLTCPQFLPEDLQHTFTLGRVRGTWIKTVFSPGLFVRNRYGAGVLKHSQSWLMTNLEHSYSEYKPGQFLKCENPNHHACLDQFPADGNIPFFVH